MRLKQLFCKHIWKLEHVEFLDQIQYITTHALVDIDTYDVYACYYNCIKCNKKNIIKKRKLVI